jgi:hypothetical protein
MLLYGPSERRQTDLPTGDRLQPGGRGRPRRAKKISRTANRPPGQVTRLLEQPSCPGEHALDLFGSNRSALIGIRGPKVNSWREKTRFRLNRAPERNSLRAPRFSEGLMHPTHCRFRRKKTKQTPFLLP